jgi:hypothetical protein
MLGEFNLETAVGRARVVMMFGMTKLSVHAVVAAIASGLLRFLGSSLAASLGV